MNSQNIWIFIGALSGFLSVAFGAFGAHALKEKLSPEMLAIFHTGAQYQMMHSLALIGFGLWMSSRQLSSFPGVVFTLGIILFSGSLYALSLSGVKALGMITPLGGLCFMLGWLSFAWQAFRAS